MSYCLDDGSPLLYGPTPTSAADSSVTGTLPLLDAADEENTRMLLGSWAADAKTINLSGFEVSSGTSANSIAVLPFANISSDPENEFFCDGLSEELLNALSRVEGLRVAARTSAFSFKGKHVDIRKIGATLNVGKILEGSVRRAGEKVRISVQLVDVSDGFHIWSARYDREMLSIFDVQDEITLAVVEALKVELLSDMRSKVLKRYTDDTEAYESYLKGRFHHYKYTEDGWRLAIEYYEKAIEKEPLYAPAFAGLTSALGYLYFFGLISADQAIPRMRTAAENALRIDDRLSEAHLSAAMVSFFYDWDGRAAERSFHKAIELDNGGAESASFYSMFLSFQERYDEAAAQCEISLARDPLSLLTNMNAGWTYFTAGDLGRAREIIQGMIEIDPSFYGSYWIKGAIALTTGEYSGAITELRKAMELGGHQTVLADLGSAYALSGQMDDARNVLTQLLEFREDSYVAAICLVRVYSRLGDNGRALEWLKTAFEERNGELLFLRSEMIAAPDEDPLKATALDEEVLELFREANI